MSPPRLLDLLLLVGVFLSRSLSVSLFAPTLPALSEALGVSYEGAGSLVFVLFAGYTIAVAIGGPAGDRVGRRPLLVGGAALNALATLSVAVVRDMTEARVAAFAYGVAGIGDLTATVLLAEGGGSASGRLLSLGHGAFAIGAVVVPLAAGAALESSVPYQALYAVAGACNLALLAGLLALPRLGARAEVAPAATAVAGGPSTPIQLASLPLFLALAATFLYMCAEAGFAIWLPTLFQDRFGAGPGLSAASAAAYWAAMGVGRIGMSRVVDRVERGRLLATLALSGAAASAACLVLPWVGWAMAAAAGTGLAMSACVPILQSVVAGTFPGAGGAALGALGIATGAGGAFAPWVVGVVADSGAGLGRAMWLVVASLVALAVAGHATARSCAGGPLPDRRDSPESRDGAASRPGPGATS